MPRVLGLMSSFVDGNYKKTQNAFPAKVRTLIIIKEVLGLDPVHFARMSS